MRVKYPRTLHHPTSPGVQSDDKIAPDLSALEGVEVIITEKMDGENTTIYADGFHARSLDSGRHPARDWLARFQAERGYMIPAGWRMCGENVCAARGSLFGPARVFSWLFDLDRRGNVSVLG